MYNAGMEFNGGTQVFSRKNLFIHGGWTICAAPPDYGGGSYDTYIDSAFMWSSLCGMDKCAAFWQANVTNHTAAGNAPCKYEGDFNVAVVNSTGTLATPFTGWDSFYCGLGLEEWRARMNQDRSTVQLNGDPEYTPPKVLARARAMLWQQARQAD
jgi:hypothetical protein